MKNEAILATLVYVSFDFQEFGQKYLICMVTQCSTKAYFLGLKATYKEYGVNITLCNYKHVVYTVNIHYFFFSFFIAVFSEGTKSI